MNMIKEHRHIFLILMITYFYCMYIDSRLHKVEKDLAVMEAILVTKGIIPVDLSNVEL